MATVQVAYTTGYSDFDTVAEYAVTGWDTAWSGTIANSLTSLSNSCYVTAGPPYNVAHLSKALDYKGDFVTSQSIPAGYTITALKLRSYIDITYVNTHTLYANLNQTDTAQKSKLISSVSPHYEYLEQSGSLASWGLSQAQAVALIDGTTQTRIWCGCTSAPLAFGLSNYIGAQLDISYTVPETLATQEGGYLIGMAA